jgi:hypothetical protein
MDSLRELPELTWLRLESPAIGSKGLAALKGMSNLEIVDLRGTQAGGGAAYAFLSMSRLKRVFIPYETSERDLAQYRRLLPAGVRISRGDPMEEIGLTSSGFQSSKQ